MSQEFDPRSVARRYAFLSKVPVELRGFVFASQHGEFEERAAGVATWSEALRAGELPPPASWPGDAVSAPARLAIEQLGILRFARKAPEVADALLTLALSSFETSGTGLAREVERLLAELEELEHADVAPASDDSADARRIRRDALRAAAQERAESQPSPPDAAIMQEFEQKVRAWSAVSEIFGDLGSLLGRGFDLSTGVLRHVGWHETVRLATMLERLPQLRAVIEALGRMRDSDSAEESMHRVFEPMLRLEEELRERVVPGIPPDVRGVERSGDLQRMLPSESVLLTHPKLRMLWHARRAERALMTYRVEGVMYDRTVVETHAPVEQERKRPRPNRGPIVAVIDTSGSMHGTPEIVAKAVVLQALRTAHAERRRCYVFAYSGPTQVIEHELSLTPVGIPPLLEFLGQRFGGGTDVGVLSRVVSLLDSEDWRKADVLFATDGIWNASPDLLAAVEAARGKGSRFHGIQIGGGGQSRLPQVCDQVHEFREWAAILGRA